MSVSFKNKFRDFLWFTHYCMFRVVRGAPWLILLPCACVFFGARALSPQPATAFVGILDFVAVAAVAGSLSLFLFALAVYSLVSVCSPSGMRVSQEQTIALTEQSILVRSPRTQMKITWHEVRRLAQTKHYLILHFHEFAALIIPRRAFQSDRQCHTFYVYCERMSRAD